MKYIVLALFVAAAVAAPTPEANSEPVELIVNGLAEGQPLEIGSIVDIKLKEHNNGVIASSVDLLHPLTAEGIAEVAAAAEAAQQEITPVQIVDNKPEVDSEVIAVIPIPESEVYEPVPETIAVIPIPEIESSPDVAPIVLPSPGEPEVVPSPIVLLPPELPMVVEEVDPSPVVLPEPEPLPEPAPQIPDGEVFNNGLVQVEVNGIENAGMFSTIQSWFSIVVNYISNGIQTTQQIV